MSRTCARPGCSSTAAATLTYDYAASVAWLSPVESSPHPMSYDLCEPHAEGLLVPRGWELEDRRSPLGSVDGRLAS